ncbi:MAG: DUF2851 family protein, partial [Terrimicrobiaceae bacterium]|nr:DUF2851 family protein [Terrimicrobiaceae bacterium]
MRGLERYALARRAAALREEPPPWRRPSEIELQARFFAGEFGLRWRGESGESIEILHPGRWNREPGPDFSGATVRVDGLDRRGDIELDREGADWERHGHATNPAYGNVVLHAFFSRGRRRFFTRNFRNEEVPQVCLGPPVPASAAPIPPRSAAGDSEAPAVGELRGLVEAAAQFRLARKREAWLRAVELHGRQEALFQALAAGLGYKNNSLPFLLAAQRVGLA